MDLGVGSHRGPSCKLGIVLGCVAWAKGSLKHKTMWRRCCLAGEFLTYPLWWCRQEAAAKATHYISALPSPCSGRPPLESGLGEAGTPPWLYLVCLCGQDLPCRSGEFLSTMWPKPATSVSLSLLTRNCCSLCWHSGQCPHRPS